MIKPSTFSIVALDPATGELGVATQSKFLAVGAVVPWARANVGAIATQSWANTSYGPKGLDLLEQGLSPQEVLDRLLEEDPDREFRQVGIVDFQGRSATFTGSECFPWAGGRSGPYYACQGNILVSEDTVIAMEQTFNETGGELADRLIAALQAGQKAGGDSRGQQSAALLVVKDKGGYGGFNDIYIDLRVDDHSSPIDELARLLRLHKLYFPRENEELLEIDDNILSEISSALSSLGYLEDSNQDKESIMKAFEKFAMKENLEERLREDNKIYRIVLDFLAEKASNR